MPERQLSTPVPLCRLDELTGWRLSIRCGRCRRRTMTTIESLATRHGHALALWRVVSRLRCQALGRDGRKCGGKPDLVSLIRGRERRKDFLVTDEITVLDDRLRITD